MKVFAVIGSPIGHSKSPYMHMKNFNRMDLPYSYVSFHVESNDLEKAIEGMRALQIAGMNVTIPHKENVISLLDDIDEEAKIIGAVNTIVNTNGKLKGYNTDGQGFLLGLKSLLKQDNIEGKRVLLIGAGGAARGIAYILRKNGCQVSVANRTIEKARTLCKELSLQTCMTLKEAEETMGAYEIIVNTTSVGMSPNSNETPVNVELVKKGTFVVDIIYNPYETKFLQEAKEKGAIIQNGLPMFVNQGALAVEKWTGIFPDANKMNEDMKKVLGGTTC